MFYGCSTSEKKVEKFAKGLTEDFINKDSVNLYNKQIDGETAGKWGLLIFINGGDYSPDKPISPKQLVELSKQRYLESKNYELESLGRLIKRFDNSFNSKIVSIKTDTLYVSQEGDVVNLLRKLPFKKHYKLYRITQLLKTEKGDSVYFRPGFIIELGNDLYFDRQGLKYSDEKF